MIKNVLLLCLSLVLCVSLNAQSIKIGSGMLDSNKKQKSLTAIQNAKKNDGVRYEVMRFEKLPNKTNINFLATQGITLLSYIQDKLYYVSVTKVDSSNQLMSNSTDFKITGVYDIDPLWKVSNRIDIDIDNGSDYIPTYAKDGKDKAKLNVQYFENTQRSVVERALRAANASIIHSQREFNTVTISIDLKNLKTLASNGFIKWIEYVSPPLQLGNVPGRTITRASILNSSFLGQRGLNGEGMIVGIWDGSIQHHPDLGNRLQSMEYEKPSSHGQHVSGTVLGSGLIDPTAKGMASKANVLGWNFSGIGSNGLTTSQEMLKSVRDYNISLTQNSYGVSKKEINCVSPGPYDARASQLDFLVNKYPKLSHIFSVGNNQTSCLPFSGSRFAGTKYNTSSKRAKNAIFVGAVDKNGKMSDFSSWGPTLDGRLIPHISAFGVDVYSTSYDNSYEIMSGTSMACPNTSGVMTLVYQRYKQIHGVDPLSSLAKAALLNTATDLGTPGPDFQHGYGLIDGVRTVSLLEKEQYWVSDVQQGSSNTHTINVPAGVKKLRVMLLWTDKSGKANNKDLINDLDLTVNGIKPWVLDPLNPSLPAVQKIDRLNNQEQVTIDNPSVGAVSVYVSGFAIPDGGAQQYSLVYHYEKEELSMVFPNGGEKFSPGDEVVLMWDSQGYTGKKSVEISIDGGVTYSVIQSDIPVENNTINYVIPNVVTNNALIRIVQNGTTAKSLAEFSIMPTPKNLKVTSLDNCGDSNKLTWDAVPGATYKILKADVDLGTYSPVTTVATNSYTLLLPELQNDRNIFSVVAVSSTGVESERAFAVLVEKSKPLDLAQVALPFQEDFVVYPSTQMKLNTGVGLDVKYVPTLFRYDSSHLINVKGNGTATWNGSTDVFTDNPDNVANLKICELNATAHTGDLWLRVASVLGKTATGDARLRVRVGSTIVPDLNGNSEITEVISGQNILYWNLTSALVGNNKSVQIESVVKGVQDSLLVGHIKLFKPIKDVSIDFKAPQVSSSLTNSETITVTIRNKSGYPVSNLPVSYKINGNSPVDEVVNTIIAPFSKLTYNFIQKADLSAVDVLFEIKAKVDYTGDEKLENNEVTDTTTRIGDYHLMPITPSGNNIVAKVIPKDFTDPSGKLLNYGTRIQGITVISPETSGLKSKIKFTSFDLEANDRVEIRNGNSSYSDLLAVLTGDNLTLPVEYVSSSYYGQLYVKFISDSKDTKPGWIAEVSEVVDPSGLESNTFSLKGFGYSVDNGNYTTPQDISIRVKNNSLSVQTNVNVRYRVNGGSWFTGLIPSIADGATKTHIFADKVTIPAGEKFELEAEVVNIDPYMDDNTHIEEFSSDYYCFSKTKNYASYPNVPVCISQVSKDGVTNITSDNKIPTKFPQYFRDIKFQVYRDLSQNVIKVNLGDYLKDGAQIQLWVDWDKDNVYDSSSFTSVTTVLADKEYDLPITSIPVSSIAGDYNIRIRVIDGSSTNPCLSSYSVIGDTEDYTIELINNFPISDDLALVSSPLAGGVSLTSTETVTVLVENLGTNPLVNFPISYEINGGTVVTETCSISVPAFGSHLYTFTQKADLSAGGGYEFKFTVNATGDQVSSNNEFVKLILNEVPQNAFVALDFDGVDDALDLGDLGNKNLESSTYEAWINPESYGEYGAVGFGRLFQGKNAIIFLHGETNTNYPDHSLIVSVGGGKFHTDANAIDLNRWQHVAVTYDNASRQTKIYIDGISVNVIEKTPATSVSANGSNKLFVGNTEGGGRAFEGMIDQIRIWDIVRSDTDISTNLHATSLTTAGLVAEYEISEGYFNTKVYSSVGSFEGNLLNADVSNNLTTSIWQEPKVDFSSFLVTDQVIDFVDVAPNHIKSEIPNIADITSVISTYDVNMKNATVEVGAVAQTSTQTSNDFTNSTTIPVEYVLSASHLGRNLTTTIRVELKKEQPAVAELLTFGIPALLSPITQDNSILVSSSFDVTNVITQFTITAGAKAYVNGNLVSSPVTMDFSNPVVIKVLAANERTFKLYSIALVKSQTITWAAPTLAKTYGDTPVVLQATPSLATGELYYESSDSSVIAIVLNKAIIKGQGTAIITASGSGAMAVAAPVSHTFTVAKAELTVTATDKTIDFSDAIPTLAYTYSGFVNSEDKTVLTTEPTISTTAVLNSPHGSYPIALSGGSADNYTFTLVNGTLTVNNVQVYALSFVVKQSGTPIQGAEIKINGNTLTSDVDGKVSITMKDATYSYTVTKAGKESLAATSIVLDADKVVNIEMEDTLPFFDLTYNTDGNGTISGLSSQSIKKGTNGTEVIAVPNTGYVFDKWNDGVLTKKRTELNVQSTKTYTAKFKVKSYALKYVAGTGTISGVSIQSVNHGQDGTAVTVTAPSGFFFTKWSDGVTDNPRTDTNIISNITVTAVYGMTYGLPYTQDFETGNGTTPPADWLNESNILNTAIWEFRTPDAIGEYPPMPTPATAKHAYLSSYGHGGDTDANLISPIFDLTNYEDIELSFFHKYSKYGASNQSAKLSYTIDGGSNWIVLKDFDPFTSSDPFRIDTFVSDPAVTPNISAVEGEPSVRFKWTYKGDNADYWVIDNVDIKGTRNGYSVKYVADTNGSITGTTTQNLPTGQTTAQVTAVANTGYKFVKWNDGILTVNRTDVVGTTDITLTAEFTKIYKVNYEALVNGVIQGLNEQFVIAGVATTQVKAVGITGYIFKEWNDVNTSSTRTDNVTQDKTFTASFVKGYAVSYVAGSNGSITGTALQILEDGLTTSQVTAVPATGYEFVKWNDGETSITRTDVADSDKVLVAEFTEVVVTPTTQYTVSYVAGSNGSITGTVTQTLNDGLTTSQVTAVGSTGYVFVKWNDGGTSVTRTDVADSDKVLVAEFTEVVVTPTTQYTVSYVAGSNGSITGVLTQTLNDGVTTTEVEAVASTGYVFVKWNDGNTSVTRTDVADSDKVLVAEFTEVVVTPTTQYTVSYVAGSNGSITGTLLQLLDNGVTTTEVEAVASTGYEFVKWNDGETSVTRTDVADSYKVLVAEFTEVVVTPTTQYTVSYVAGSNGSITGIVTQTLDDGITTTEVEAVPSKGYVFVEWNDGNTSPTRTDIADADNVFVAGFVKINNNVSYAITPNNDNVNDVWEVEGNNSQIKYSVSLYNRSGRLVYESSDYKNDFIGVDKNGNNLQTGSYIYIINYTKKGKAETLKDWLYIKY